MNMAFWKMSAHLASLAPRLDIPLSSFLPITGTSQIPTRMEMVMTSVILTNC